jgi:8-oxo-dGTP pyrophosphatase MutT (NUDIX family)
MQHKALAYLTRRNASQLLVFEHRDNPEAGVQVPAGTQDTGETIEQTLWREVLEESGLRPEQLRLVGKLAEYESAEWQTVRHVFHLEAVADLPDAWTHVVCSDAGDNGLVFEYRWENLPLALALAGAQDLFLNLIEKSDPALP